MGAHSGSNMRGYIERYRDMREKESERERERRREKERETERVIPRDKAAMRETY